MPMWQKTIIKVIYKCQNLGNTDLVETQEEKRKIKWLSQS